MYNSITKIMKYIYIYKSKICIKFVCQKLKSTDEIKENLNKWRGIYCVHVLENLILLRCHLSINRDSIQSKSQQVVL